MALFVTGTDLEADCFLSITITSLNLFPSNFSTSTTNVLLTNTWENWPIKMKRNTVYVCHIIISLIFVSMRWWWNPPLLHYIYIYIYLYIYISIYIYLYIYLYLYLYLYLYIYIYLSLSIYIYINSVYILNAQSWCFDSTEAKNHTKKWKQTKR